MEKRDLQFLETCRYDNFLSVMRFESVVAEDNIHYLDIKLEEIFAGQIGVSITASQKLWQLPKYRDAV